MNIKRPLQLILSNFIGLFLATLVLEGFYVEKKIVVFLLGASLLMVGQIFVRPILKFISFPINMITLGLFNLVINSAILFLTVYLIDGISVNSGFITVSIPFYGLLFPSIELGKWLTLIVGAIIIDLTNWTMKKLVF